MTKEAIVKVLKKNGYKQDGDVYYRDNYRIIVYRLSTTIMEQKKPKGSWQIIRSAFNDYISLNEKGQLTFNTIPSKT